MIEVWWAFKVFVARKGGYCKALLELLEGVVFILVMLIASILVAFWFLKGIF